MIRKDKIAIVRVQVRDNTQVRFCALLPQDEKFDDMSGIQTPPGFQLIVLPFADDIRSLDNIMEAAGFQKSDDRMDEPAIVDQLRPEEKNAARLLIKNLTIDFDPRNFENPSIQKFYSGL